MSKDKICVFLLLLLYSVTFLFLAVESIMPRNCNYKFDHKI